MKTQIKIIKNILVTIILLVPSFSLLAAEQKATTDLFCAASTEDKFITAANDSIEIINNRMKVFFTEVVENAPPYFFKKLKEDKGLGKDFQNYLAPTKSKLDKITKNKEYLEHLRLLKDDFKKDLQLKELSIKTDDALKTLYNNTIKPICKNTGVITKANRDDYAKLVGLIESIENEQEFKRKSTSEQQDILFELYDNKVLYNILDVDSAEYKKERLFLEFFDSFQEDYNAHKKMFSSFTEEHQQYKKKLISYTNGEVEPILVKFCEIDGTINSFKKVVRTVSKNSTGGTEKNLINGGTNQEKGIGLLSTNVTTVAKGVAKFLSNRAKAELNIAFFKGLKKQINKNPYFKNYFPKTKIVLSSIGTEIYQYEQYLDLLKSSFESDLKLLPRTLLDGKIIGNKITAICNDTDIFFNYNNLLKSIATIKNWRRI